MDHGGEIVRSLQFDFQARDQCLLHQRQSDRIGRVDMFHQCFTVIDRVRERDHSGSEEIVRCQLVRFHHAETPYDVRNESAHALEIADVVSDEFPVDFRQLRRAQRNVTIVKLLGGEEFSRGRRR